LESFSNPRNSFLTSRSTILDLNRSVPTKLCYPEPARTFTPSPLRHQEPAELDLSPSSETNDVDPGFHARAEQRRERYEILGLDHGLSENLIIADSIKMTVAKLTRNLHLSSTSDDQSEFFDKAILGVSEVCCRPDREDVEVIANSIKTTIANMTKNLHFSSIAEDQSDMLCHTELDMTEGLCCGFASDDISAFTENLTATKPTKNPDPISTLDDHPQVSNHAMLDVTETPRGSDREDLEDLDMPADGPNIMEGVIEEVRWKPTRC
jgi:hypothetical protein